MSSRYPASRNKRRVKELCRYVAISEKLQRPGHSRTVMHRHTRPRDRDRSLGTTGLGPHTLDGAAGLNMGLS